MCLSPLKIHNPTKRLDIYRGHQLYIQVPCCKCSECIAQKRSDYYVRSYSEYRRCLDNNGFAFWDTLTMQDKYLTRYLGVPCFSQEMIRNFLKRLNIHITRFMEHNLPGYKFEASKDLRHFITSEFGEKKHRPHYHVIFFCTIPGFYPEDLNRLIQKSWSFYNFKKKKYEYIGRTDWTKTPFDKVLHGTSAINYVSKYVTKDDKYIETFQRSIQRYCPPIHDTNNYEEFQKDVRRYYPFHLQSEGFGSELINQTDPEEFNQFKCRVPDTKLPFKYVALPQYNIRKAFYNLLKDTDGKYYWQLNEKGIKAFKDNLDNRISAYADKVIGYINNADFGIGTCFNSNYFINKIRKLLDGRSITDFAKYVICYKDRMILDTIEKPPTYKWLYESALTAFNYPDKFINHLAHDYFRWCMVTHEVLDSEGNYTTALNPDGSPHYVRKLYKCRHVVNENHKSDIATEKCLRSKYAINENRFYEFRDFDKIYDLLYIYLKPFTISKNVYSTFNDNLYSKFKNQLCENS